MENRAADRRGKVALDQVFPAQEIVTGVGLPVACLGFDGPGCGLAVRGGLRAADGGVELIQPAIFPQLGPEHAVILRETARIVSLHIDDVAAYNAPRNGTPRRNGGDAFRVFTPPIPLLPCP